MATEPHQSTIHQAEPSGGGGSWVAGEGEVGRLPPDGDGGRGGGEGAIGYLPVLTKISDFCLVI